MAQGDNSQAVNVKLFMLTLYAKNLKSQGFFEKMEDTSDILTFDELQEDNYYKSKFEKRLQQKINRISHSGVKGGINMGKIQQQPNEGEIKNQTPSNFETISNFV